MLESAKRALSKSPPLRLAVSLGSAYLAFKLSQPLFWLVGVAAGFGVFRYSNNRMAEWAANDRWQRRSEYDWQSRNALARYLLSGMERQFTQQRDLQGSIRDLALVELRADNRIRDRLESAGDIQLGNVISFSEQSLNIWPTLTPSLNRTRFIEMVMPVHTRSGNNGNGPIAYAQVKARIEEGIPHVDEIKIYRDVNGHELLGTLNAQKSPIIDVDPK